MKITNSKLKSKLKLSIELEYEILELNNPRLEYILKYRKENPFWQYELLNELRNQYPEKCNKLWNKIINDIPIHLIKKSIKYS